ncbi:MAG TPA: hypothetical protein VM488_11520 [Pseudobacter sp.]|jgi:hypothetical protein|nr:hypothetical protein [Pseudobacter sp.]
MTGLSMKSLSRNAFVLAGIIFVVRIILYLPYVWMPFGARNFINIIYPHNLMEMLGNMVAIAYKQTFLRNFPFLPLVFAACLVFAAAQLRSKGKTRFLKFCYYILITSCILAIPLSLYSIIEIKAYYSKHMPSLQPPVPPLWIIILNIIALLGYASWSSWQIRQLNKLPAKLIEEALASIE